MPRLHDVTTDVLPRVHRFARGSTALQLIAALREEAVELAPAVDDGNDDVPTLASPGVECVPAYDVAASVVVAVLHLGHGGSIADLPSNDI
jgi:hypothetical protein